MKILFIVHGYKPAYKLGGPIESVSAVAEGLVQRGHHVTVFTTTCNLDEDLDVETDKPVKVNGVDVWYFRRIEPIKKLLPFLPYFSQSVGYLYAPRMRAALNRIMPEIDIVHTHLPFMYPTFAAGWAAVRHGKPLFYHQRGVFDRERLKFRGWKKRLYIRFMEVPLLRRANTLISLTEAETASYRALGVKTRCAVIPNGIDTRQYWQRVPEAWHAALDIPAGAMVILFLGRLHTTKGVDRLVHSFLQIRHRFPRTVLICAGQDESGLQKKLQDQIRNKEDAAAVRFPGMVNGDCKKALLARADLLCLLSDAEGFSMTVLEAMASRTALLLSPGCHFDAIESEGAGRITPLDSTSIQEALGDLLSKPDQLEAMGTRGLNWVKRDYQWDRIVDQFVALYSRAIQGSRRI